MLRPTATSVRAEEGYILDVEFDNGERKRFDVKPYIKGSWYGKLENPDYFRRVRTDVLLYGRKVRISVRMNCIHKAPASQNKEHNLPPAAKK